MLFSNKKVMSDWKFYDNDVNNNNNNNKYYKYYLLKEWLH